MKYAWKKIPTLLSITLLGATSLACATPKTDDSPQSWPEIKHVVLILLENETIQNALKQPYLKSLYQQGAGLSHNTAITHPSQPNYIALVAGTTDGVTNDDNVTVTYKNIADLLEAKGLTWKAYAEGWPGHCFLGEKSGSYYRKHVPFLSFQSVQSNPARCANIATGADFFTDLAAGKLPAYSFYVPDINNDGHNTNVAYASRWLKKTFGPVLSNPDVLKDTLFIITFDEGIGRNNVVYTAFVGAGVKPGTLSSVPYTHYSILKTVEAILGTGELGTHDSKARQIDDIWQS